MYRTNHSSAGPRRVQGKPSSGRDRRRAERACLFCLAALVAFASPAVAETVFHVAPTGNDLNPGTRSKPFATLERAREAVRMAGLGTARRVIVHGGSYELRTTFTLGRLDSGTATAPGDLAGGAG